MNKKGRVLVAMSGGIDSSLAAVLLKEEGFEIVGITIKTGDYSDTSYIKNEALCCNYDSINIARAIAVKESFPHYVVDMTVEFGKQIITDFINEYLQGRTPNPCVRCNPIIKSTALIKLADQLDCEFIATGHYANIRFENGRYLISKGADETKDQSYVLWGLSQENLKRTMFPLGKFKKNEIKQLASEKGFDSLFINKRESFEICFIPDNDYRGFLKSKVPGLKEKYENGNFVDVDGKILGKHKGYPFYTIGQRKGLEIAVGEPLYVKEIQRETNTVVLARRDSLNNAEMFVSDYNGIKYSSIPVDVRLTTKVRYHDKGTLSTIKADNNQQILKVIFDEDVFAITPGQSAVFYEGDDLVGGGIITMSNEQ